MVLSFVERRKWARFFLFNHLGSKNLSTPMNKKLSTFLSFFAFFFPWLKWPKIILTLQKWMIHRVSEDSEPLAWRFANIGQGPVCLGEFFSERVSPDRVYLILNFSSLIGWWWGILIFRTRRNSQEDDEYLWERRLTWSCLSSPQFLNSSDSQTLARGSAQIEFSYNGFESFFSQKRQ